MVRARGMYVVAALVAFAGSVSAAREDPADCEVCRAVIHEIDGMLTPAERKSNEKIEGVMQTYCDDKGSKGKEKAMCYYMGMGTKEGGSAGGVKRDISSSLGRGINAVRLCKRLKKKDAQMCELRFEKKIDIHNTDLKKLRVKELRKICDSENLSTKGLVEKDEYIKKIKDHFGIKDEV